MTMPRLATLALALALVAPLPACSGPVNPPVTNASSAPAGPEWRATVRIDPAPGGKHFQGVWLAFDGGARWVVDYRARSIWSSFADRAVLVTGRCYTPEGQAIGAQHFEVHRMRLADAARPAVPLLAIGPERRLRGVFAERAFPPGSKRAGDSELVFRAEDGAEYKVLYDRADVPLGAAVAVDARQVEQNLAYMATTGGPSLWIFDVLDAGAGARDPGRSYGDCPDPAAAGGAPGT